MPSVSLDHKNPREWRRAVNPFENHGEFGQGIDDVMVDAAGNYWVVEYKGGQGALQAGQMQQPWVASKINELISYKNDFTGWGATLDSAFQAGKLRGVAVKTP